MVCGLLSVVQRLGQGNLTQHTIEAGQLGKPRRCRVVSSVTSTSFPPARGDIWKRADARGDRGDYRPSSAVGGGWVSYPPAWPVFRLTMDTSRGDRRRGRGTPPRPNAAALLNDGPWTGSSEWGANGAGRPRKKTSPRLRTRLRTPQRAAIQLGGVTQRAVAAVVLFGWASLVPDHRSTLPIHRLFPLHLVLCRLGSRPVARCRSLSNSVPVSLP